MKNNLKVGDKVKVRIYGIDGKAIKTNNFDDVFEVVQENGKLGIYWTEDFTPFESFCNTEFVKQEKSIEELEEILLKECPKHETDCTACPYSKECDEYARLKNLIIEQ